MDDPAILRGATPRRTEDEWADIRRRADARAAERDERQSGARAEGGRLLAMVLDVLQLATLEAERFFDVVGASGQLWRVHYGTSGNVRALDRDGREIMRICAHPALRDHERDGWLPTEDVLAGHSAHGCRWAVRV